MTDALFSDEGPEYYAAAYEHNRPFAVPGPYQTPLEPAEEKSFRSWVHRNKVPFDPDEDPSDYDMRGYWRDNHGAMPTEREPDTGAYGWPDTYKTPYDTTFSEESRYATVDNPFCWDGNQLIDRRSGALIFDRGGGEQEESAPPPSSPASPASPPLEQLPPPTQPANAYGTQWHMEAVLPDGSRRMIQPVARGGGEWEVLLLPGEHLDVVTYGENVGMG